MKQTILVVEDDGMIRRLVRIYLEKQGYNVEEAVDGETARKVYLDAYPRLVILDLMLPRLSGEAFCRWVQEEAPEEAPIVMLSAKAQTQDKIAGLNMGADGYVTKPFDPDELVAQVNAVLRRTAQLDHKLVHDGLCIMPRKGKVLLHETPLELTKHEFTLLKHFMQAPDVVFTRDELMLQLYPNEESIVLDRTIDAHVKKLRNKIEYEPSRPARILTVRGMGYKYVAY